MADESRILIPAEIDTESIRASVHSWRSGPRSPIPSGSSSSRLPMTRGSLEKPSPQVNCCPLVRAGILPDPTRRTPPAPRSALSSQPQTLPIADATTIGSQRAR